jgi:hypothetical protein
MTYKEIKEKVLVDEETAIVSLNKATKASSYLMELNLREVLEDFRQKINVYKVNEREQKHVIDDFQLFSEPSILIFVNGVLRDVIYFPVSKKCLQDKLTAIFNEQC